MYLLFSQPKEFISLIPESFRLYRAAFLRLLIPILVLMGVAFWVGHVTQHVMPLNHGDMVTTHIQPSLAFRHHVGWFLASSLLSIFLYALMLLKIDQAAKGAEASALIRALKKFPAFLGLTIISSIMLVIGFLLFVIPGIYLWPLISLFLCSMLFENTSMFGSIKNGFHLVRGFWWRVFGTNVVMCLIVMLIMFAAIILNVVLALFAHRVGFHPSLVAVTIYIVIYGVIYPLMMCFSYLIYQNLMKYKRATAS